MKNLFEKLRQRKLIGRIVHTLDYLLQRELIDCESVLDLGCGPSSPVQRCEKIKYSVGVEIFKPYLEESKRKKIHTEYISKKIEEINFSENSFDAVILIEVMEHLPKEIGLKIIKRAEKWARKKVIISTPNGYFPMGDVDSNQYQKHLSGWTIQEFSSLGFKSQGVSGLKFFYTDKGLVKSILEDNNIWENIRLRPKKLFYLVNGFMQIFSYYFPNIAFGLFTVKKIKKK